MYVKAVAKLEKEGKVDVSNRTPTTRLVSNTRLQALIQKKYGLDAGKNISLESCFLPVRCSTRTYTHPTTWQQGPASTVHDRITLGRSAFRCSVRRIFFRTGLGMLR